MTLFILGCSIMQEPALRQAGEWGWTVHAADGNEKAVHRGLCDVFHHVDLKDNDMLIQVARKIRDTEGLDGVFTTGTDFSHAVASIAHELSLPGHGPDAAWKATDKVAMRTCFRNHGIPSPSFAEIAAGQDPLQTVGAIPGPWVVKPVDSMGARGVRRIDSVQDIEEAVRKACNYSRTGRALVETFMEGPEFSLDALVCNNRIVHCGLADRHIEHAPYFIETGHTIPSSVDQKTASLLWTCFEKGIKALGLSWGAAKGDLKLAPSGPMIGEIAARLSGGYMSGWTWPCASGQSATMGALRLAVGLEPELESVDTTDRVCAERALCGIDGTVLRIGGKDDALSLDGVHSVMIRASQGDEVVFPRNNVEKVANVIATGATHQQAGQNAVLALQSLDLVLDPGDPTTGDYLDEEAGFPPNSFVFEVSVNTSRLTSQSRCSRDLYRLWSQFDPVPSSGFSEPPLSLGPLSDYFTDKWPHSLPEKPKDGCNRSLADILDILRNRDLIVMGKGSNNQDTSNFWKALIRGGLPGVLWFLNYA